jgi:hypothetical protein
MDILKIRIVLDHEEQVFRDIEIENEGSMEDLHEAILASFNIPNDQMASFYESDEHWEKGPEIALMDMGTSEEPVKLMAESSIADTLQERSRLLYVYDFLNLRIFYVEVIAMGTHDSSKEYPQLIMALGDLPKMENPFDLESLMEGVDLDESRDNTLVPKTDDWDDSLDDDWEDDSGAMDNIDDYEGLI